MRSVLIKKQTDLVFLGSDSEQVLPSRPIVPSPPGHPPVASQSRAGPNSNHVEKEHKTPAPFPSQLTARHAGILKRILGVEGETGRAAS